MDLEKWKRIKKEKKLTFDALAEKSNIPKRTLEDIFSGRTVEPRITTVEAIERALGLNQPQIQKDPVIKDMGHASLEMTQGVYTDTQAHYIEAFADLVRGAFDT